MSVTVTLATSITIRDGDADVDSTTPIYVVEKTIAALTTVAPPRRQVVNNTTVTLWSAGAVGAFPTSFSLMAIWCDTSSLEVELTCNDGDAAEAIFTVTLVPGIPLILGSDDSRYNTGALTGSADVIDLVRVKNGSATNAVVNLVLAA